MSAFPFFASAIITSAVPARHRRHWHLVHVLRDLGETPVVLSRGYGGKLRGPVKVDPSRHVAADVGDEPLMMARQVAVVISGDRVAGAALARSTGASVIVMDDGFQNPAIAKDASFIVIDSNRGLGNGRVLPAGPLRAPLDLQIARTDALVVIGDGVAATGVAALVAGQGGPVLTARLVPAETSVSSLARQARAGLCGDRRSPTLLPHVASSQVWTWLWRRPSPITTRMRPAEIDALAVQAKRDGLVLVTTEKDVVKLSSMPAAAEIVPFAVTLAFEDKAALQAFVIEKLNQARVKTLRM